MVRGRLRRGGASFVSLSTSLRWLLLLESSAPGQEVHWNPTPAPVPLPLRCRMRQAGLAWHFETFTLRAAGWRAREPAPFFRKCPQLFQKPSGHLVLGYIASTVSTPRGMGSNPTGVTQATYKRLHAPETY